MKKAETQVEKQEPQYAVVLNASVMETVRQVVGEIPSKYGIVLMEIFSKNTFEVKPEQIESK